MSDNSSSIIESAEVPTINSMAAFSDELKEITAALDLLYIKYNASGRNKFRDKYPKVALYIFGEQLIKYDNEGAQDLNHRIQLEQEADDRRIELKVTLSEIVDKSVEQGLLQSEYVKEVIEKYGVEVSKFLYAENIIKRTCPDLISENKSDEDEEAKNKENVQENNDNPEEEKLSKEEKSILSNVPEDEYSDIKPIETSQPLEDKQNPPELPEEKEEIIEKVIYKNIFNSAAFGK